jgi:trehalose-6-phosphate hydrolase
VFWHYHRLIELRKTVPLVTTGAYELLDREHPDVFAYLRRGDGETLLVVCSFRGSDTTYAWPPGLLEQYPTRRVLLTNDEPPQEDEAGLRLRPYEAIVFHLEAAS